MNRNSFFQWTCLALACCLAQGGARAETPTQGAKVIGLWGSSYYSGTVQSISGDQVIVKWDDGSSPSGSPLAETLSMPQEGVKPEIKVGDAGYCNYSSTAWRPCLVSSIGEGGVVVSNPADGSSAELPFAKIAIPTGVAAQKLAAQTESARRALELKRSIQATAPPNGAGSPVQRGDWVVSQWTDGKWYDARVLGVEAKAVRLLWSDGSVIEGVSLDKVAPCPDLDKDFGVKVGDILYVRWSSSSQWYIAKVQGVTGPDSIDVLYQDGTKGKTRRGRYLPQAQ